MGDPHSMHRGSDGEPASLPRATKLAPPVSCFVRCRASIAELVTTESML